VTLWPDAKANLAIQFKPPAWLPALQSTAGLVLLLGRIQLATSCAACCWCGLLAPAPLYSMLRRISVVMTRQVACGLMVTSPVISPTSPNSCASSRYFWLLSALSGLVYTTRMRSLQHTGCREGERVVQG
jgi:hypothetical protein